MEDHMKTLAVVTTLLVSTAAHAAAQAPAAKTATQHAPQPPADLGQLDVFVGTWTCTGKVPATDFGPGHPTRLQVTVTRDLGGFVYTFRFAEEKTKENPLPVSGTGFWGYDVTKKELVAHSADSFGGLFVQTSKGWDGDTMTWEGEGVAMGSKVKARDEFTRKGDSLSHRYEAEREGKWVTLADETCRKAPRRPAAKR
jgi:hypothetical protein